MNTTSTRALLGRQGLAHGGVLILFACSVVALSARESAGLAGTPLYLAAAWAFLSGLVLSHIIHEWGHFLGAVISNAGVTLKPSIHPLFFDFEFPSNTPRQFLFLSMGGLAGNVLLLVVALSCATGGALVTTSLLAAVLGQLVFVLVLELPVSVGVLAGRDPLESLTTHFGQGGPLFLRAAIGGVATAALVYALY